MHRHAPGAQSIEEYAMAPVARPAVTFGYGVMDAEAIGPALQQLRRSLSR